MPNAFRMFTGMMCVLIVITAGASAGAAQEHPRMGEKFFPFLQLPGTGRDGFAAAKRAEEAYPSQVSSYDWEDDAWVESARFFYTRDAAGNILERQTWVPLEGVWTNTVRESYAYDANGNETEYTEQDLKADTWVNEGRTETIWDEAENELSTTYYDWLDDAWAPKYRILYEYDAKNRETLRLTQRWEDDAWVDYTRMEISYDDENRISETDYYEWEDGVKVLMAHVILHFNEDMQVSGAEYQEEIEGELQTTATTTVAYDEAGNPVLHEYNYLDEGEWYREAETLVYDDAGNETEDTWIGYTPDGAIDYGESSTMSYDDAGNILDIIGTEYEEGAWVNSGKTVFIYNGISGVAEEAGDVPSAIVLGANYPNPFNPATVFEVVLPARDTVSVEVYNMQGQLVGSIVRDALLPAGRHSFTWNGMNDRGEAVSSGVYFYRVRTDAAVQSRRMLLLR